MSSSRNANFVVVNMIIDTWEGVFSEPCPCTLTSLGQCTCSVCGGVSEEAPLPVWGTGSGEERGPTDSPPLNGRRKPQLSWHRAEGPLAFRCRRSGREKAVFAPNGELVGGEASVAGDLSQRVCQLDSECPPWQLGLWAHPETSLHVPSQPRGGPHAVPGPLAPEPSVSHQQ